MENGKNGNGESEFIRTSITLKQEHIDYIERKSINLSAFTRKCIEKEMRGECKK